MFETKHLPTLPDYAAPDGSEVRLLLDVARGGLAHFTLRPGHISGAVRHRTVDEIWYVLSGPAKMWRRFDDQVVTVTLEAGDCITIPIGTHFQFWSLGPGPFTAIGLTMPRWPGEGEAVRSEGPRQPTLPAGPGLPEY